MTYNNYSNMLSIYEPLSTKGSFAHQSSVPWNRLNQIETLQNWGNYVPITGASGLAGTGPSLTIYNSTLYASVIGSDGNMWVTSMNTTTGAWAFPWIAIPNGSSKVTPSIVEFNNTLYSFVVGNDSVIYYNSMNATTGAWGTAWTNIGGLALAGTGISTAIFNSKLYVAITGTDFSTWTNNMDASGHWDTAGWTSIPNTVTSSTPALSPFNGKLYSMVIAKDAGIWVNSMDTTGHWGTWTGVSGAALVGGGASLTTDGKLLYASVIGKTGNSIWVNSMNTTGTWLPAWEQLPGTATGVPALTAFSGKLYSMVIATNGDIWVDSALAIVLTTITLSPTSASVGTGGKQQFSAVCKDQNGASIVCTGLTWDTTDHVKGTITSGGLFTAGTSTGSVTVKATNGIVTGSAVVTITSAAAAAPGGGSNAAVIGLGIAGVAVVAFLLMKKK